jgi:two-component system, NarL family, nitrate/nitrite response regulator NarL
MRPARTTKRKIRILIADREGVFRLGLQKLFGLEDDLRVVAQAENSSQILALTKTFKPNLLFIQQEILAEGAGKLNSALKTAAPQSKVVVMTSPLTENDALRYVQTGASGVILRSVEPHFFVKCARKVMEDEIWLPKHHVAQMAKVMEGNAERPQRPVDTLTQREKTIISYLMQGWRNRDIANHLSITEQTVKNHLRSVYDKVGVSDRLELVLYAIHQHLDLEPAQTSDIGAQA